MEAYRRDLPTAWLRFKNDKPVLPSREVFESVRDHGIKNPLIVALVNEVGRVEPMVYVGNQRLASARILGIETLACVIVHSSEQVREAWERYEEVPA